MITKLAKFDTYNILVVMKFKLLLLKNIMWTSIKCLTEHDKNEVYQIVNTHVDVPFGYLNSMISYLYIMLCYVCYYCLQ